MSEMVQDWEAARARVLSRYMGAYQSYGTAERGWCLFSDSSREEEIGTGVTLAEAWLDADRRLREDSAKDGEPTAEQTRQLNRLLQDMKDQPFKRPAPPAEDAVDGFEAGWNEALECAAERLRKDGSEDGEGSIDLGDAIDRLLALRQAAKATPQHVFVLIPDPQDGKGHLTFQAIHSTLEGAQANLRGLTYPHRIQEVLVLEPGQTAPPNLAIPVVAQPIVVPEDVKTAQLRWMKDGDLEAGLNMADYIRELQEARDGR